MSDYTIEAKIRSKIGKIRPIEDIIKGDADMVVLTLTEKYVGKRVKKSILGKISYAFDEAGKEMERMIKDE